MPRLVAEFAQDLRFAARAIRRSPGFAVVAVVTIALGVAATTTVFSLMNALLFRPLPVHQPGRLVAVTESRTGNVSTDNGYTAIPYERYAAYREATGEVVTDLAGYRAISVALRVGEEATSVTGALTTQNYFEVLGLRPAVGRFFEAEDEPAVVLSHRVWQARFGGDRGIVGRTVYLDSRPFTVAGVAPRDFGGTLYFFNADVWVPFRGHRPGYDSSVFPFGRLRAGLEPEAAAAMVDAVARRLPPERGVEVRGALLEPLGASAQMRLWTKRFLGVVEGLAALVLLIASANIAGVLLARAVARRREIAVRLAIGAARGRLVRQLLTETLVLFFLGAVAGTALTFAATRLVASIPLPASMVVELDLSPDPVVLLFALAVAAATGFVFGLVPALRASRLELLPALRTGGRAAGAEGTRGRSVFVVAQVAAAVVLLVGAGLFLRSLQRALAVELGFEPAGVVVATTNLAPHGYDEERGRAFYSQLTERVRALPGVESVGLAQVVLVGGSAIGSDVSVMLAGATEPTTVNALHNTVDAGFFTALRVPIVRGRAFDETDRAGAPPVVVINETLARRLWPGEDAIGKRLRSSGRDLEVVGVGMDGKYWQIWEQPESFVYHPFAQDYEPRMALHVRTASSAAPMIEAIRQEVRALDPNVALERAVPLTAAVGISALPQRLGAWLIGAFGLIGLILAVLGVYSVLAFQVAQRVREIGVRIALGASTRGVLRLVLRRGALLAAAGTVSGLALAAVAARYLRSFLFGVEPSDPVTFAAVALVLGAAALLGSYIPARRAARISPMEAMRAD